MLWDVTAHFQPRCSSFGVTRSPLCPEALNQFLSWGTKKDGSRPFCSWCSPPRASPVLAWLTIRAWYKLCSIIQASVSFSWCWTATLSMSVKPIKGNRPWETKYNLTKATFSMLLCKKANCSVAIKLTEVVTDPQGKGKTERVRVKLIIIPNAKTAHFLQRVT